MSLTDSEKLFEQFCAQNSIEFRRILECGHRTPDYQVQLLGLNVICEVKEIRFSKEEREAEEALERGEVVTSGGIIGSKVRKQIDNGYKQIQTYAQGRCPGVLVLWEESWFPKHLQPFQILAAMNGFDTMVVDASVPSKVIDRKSGGKKRVSEIHNRSLSAIFAIRRSNDESVVECRIFHNKFADIPLPPELLNFDHCWQFRLKERVCGQFDEWESISA